MDTVVDKAVEQSNQTSTAGPVMASVLAAVVIGFISFVIGKGLGSSGNFDSAKNLQVGLLVSTAVAAWGIFALQLTRVLRGK